MHIIRQTMAMRIPKRSNMTQEASLLLYWEILPEVLEQRPQAVEHRLPRRSVCISRFANEADSLRQSRDAP